MQPLEEQEQTLMTRHKQAKINGQNAIITLHEHEDIHNVDVIICTDGWSPIRGYRAFSSESRENSARHIATEIGIDIDDGIVKL